jgi:hypothetical protein
MVLFDAGGFCGIFLSLLVFVCLSLDWEGVYSSTRGEWRSRHPNWLLNMGLVAQTCARRSIT